MDIEDLAYEVIPEEIVSLKDELIDLYARELFEKHIYFRQTSSLEGNIVEILKRLDGQEEKHAYILKILLEKAELEVKEYDQSELENIVYQPLNEALIYDIKQEKISADAYRDAIEKSTGKLKQVLEHILQEEFEHIGILEKFLEENV
ncbi:MAG: hypothetical protein HON47_04250 [Candidatus Diapherotrites archaeon]|jgi:hypothetical protein|uniref:Ferritin-like domain-containing protein n=1 Tax=Candidatus Iainarchaeum sp. TaxID=3101447 RepID=A0A8T5GG12_9ARCH|nr:hypothetical protein [Candidatus Diapherotrites archaeon]MBT7241750.1 hypothetical protein [Candidatus Diapherotrites archaeon]